MLRYALEDLDDNKTLPTVITFVLFCEDMMRMFKGELEELKEKSLQFDLLCCTFVYV